MESESFVAGVMKEIARDLSKPFSAFQPFIDSLHKQWIDTKESLIMLDDAALSTFGFPLAVQKKLAEKIQSLKAQQAYAANQGTNPGYPRLGSSNSLGDGGSSSPGKREVHPLLGGPSEVYEIEKEQPEFVLSKSSQPTQKQSLPGVTGPTPYSSFEHMVEEHLNHIYRSTLGTENLVALLQMLHILLDNVATKPDDLKYRVINLTKAAIQRTIGSSPFAKSLLQNLHFFENKEKNLELKGQPLPNLDHIIYTRDAVKEFGERIGRRVVNLVSQTAQIGVAGFSSTSGKSNSDVAQHNTSGIGSVMDTLEDVKRQRSALVQLTVPRRATFIEQNPGTQAGTAIDIDQQGDEANDNKLTLEQKREILKFSSKRKQELEKLLDTPLFTETVIRFKLPDGRVLQAFFSPKETVAHLRQELEKYYSPGRSWYLYTTPPPTKLEAKKNAGLTLEQLGLVPRSIVHVGLD